MIFLWDSKDIMWKSMLLDVNIPPKVYMKQYDTQEYIAEALMVFQHRFPRNTKYMNPY
jgi:hypothetical protein